MMMTMMMMGMVVEVVEWGAGGGAELVSMALA